MREIKFRAWDDELKEMLYSSIEQFDDSLMFRFNKHFEMETPIYMQYTGLKDKNGKEICEGDIVKQTYHTQTGHVYNGTDMTFDGQHIGPVVITAKGVCLKNPLHYSEDMDETNPMNAYKQVAGYRSEVIGNIHEHPNLLKELINHDQASVQDTTDEQQSKT